MFYDMILRDKDSNMSSCDLFSDPTNRQHVITVFHAMIHPDAAQKYPHYDLYLPAFQQFTNALLETHQIVNHVPDPPPCTTFLEEDKQLLVRPKPKTIVEILKK
jgi:hypothetical protein